MTIVKGRQPRTRASVFDAWKVRKARTAGNYSTDGETLFLFGNAVARHTQAGKVEVRLAGYNTVTTRATLRSIGVHVWQVYGYLGAWDPLYPSIDAVMNNTLWPDSDEWTEVYENPRKRTGEWTFEEDGLLHDATMSGVERPPAGWLDVRSRDGWLPFIQEHTIPHWDNIATKRGKLAKRLLAPSWAAVLMNAAELSVPKRRRVLKDMLATEDAIAAIEAALRLGGLRALRSLHPALNGVSALDATPPTW